MGVVQRVRSFRLSPQGRSWLARGLAAVGFAFLAKTLLEYGIEGAGGGGGIDAIAYWTAAVNVREGLPLYAIPEGEFAAYAYPPPLAQALVPLSFLPMPAFVWLWRAVELVSLRVATGSWTRSGLVLLFVPPVIAELDAGNVHLIMAAVCALAMRGVSVTVAPATLLKFASVPLAPLSWRLDRRGLLIGIAAAAAAVAASFAVAPGAWADYVGWLTTTSFPSGWYNVAEYVPLPVRLALAVVLGLAAMRWIRLAPIAVLLAYPVVWFHALSTLVAVITPLPDRVRENGTAPDASPDPAGRTSAAPAAPAARGA
jgi:hypothetical protein